MKKTSVEFHVMSTYGFVMDFATYKNAKAYAVKVLRGQTSIPIPKDGIDVWVTAVTKNIKFRAHSSKYNY